MILKMFHVKHFSVPLKPFAKMFGPRQSLAPFFRTPIKMFHVKHFVYNAKGQSERGTHAPQGPREKFLADRCNQDCCTTRVKKCKIKSLRPTKLKPPNMSANISKLIWKRSAILFLEYYACRRIKTRYYGATATSIPSQFYSSCS
jgi:hypothetical protein